MTSLLTTLRYDVCSSKIDLSIPQTINRNIKSSSKEALGFQGLEGKDRLLTNVEKKYLLIRLNEFFFQNFLEMAKVFILLSWSRLRPFLAAAWLPPCPKPPCTEP